MTIGGPELADVSGQRLSMYGIAADGAVLVRPDGHIAWRSSGAACTICHGSDLGGAVYSSSAAIGTVAGPNLTRGCGGGADYTDMDYVRAIRRGVRRDGTSLIVMPSEVFTHLSQEDMGAVLAFLKRAPPVDRVVPASGFGPMGRALLAAGR